jgi:hypothetical protein
VCLFALGIAATGLVFHFDKEFSKKFKVARLFFIAA